MPTDYTNLQVHRKRPFLGILLDMRNGHFKGGKEENFQTSLPSYFFFLSSFCIAHIYSGFMVILCWFFFLFLGKTQKFRT